VVDAQAALVAQWMLVGFVHGVMNTDNLSILGLTIDYGPYGWLEPYDPDWTPNTTDADTGPGDTAGQGFLGTWFVVSRHGNLIGKHHSTGIGRPRFWDRARYYGEEKRLAAAIDRLEAASERRAALCCAHISFSVRCSPVSSVTSRWWAR